MLTSGTIFRQIKYLFPEQHYEGYDKDFSVLFRMLRNYGVSKQKKDVANNDKILHVIAIICGVVNYRNGKNDKWLH